MIGLVGSPRTISFFFIPCCIWIISLNVLYLEIVHLVVTCLPTAFTQTNKPKQGRISHYIIFNNQVKYFATFLFRPPPHLLTLHTPIFDNLYQLWYCWIENCSSFNMIPNMINIIFALLKYNRSKSGFLTFCAGYRWHYVCKDVIIWFAYKWSKMLTKKLARGLKRCSIFQLTRFHQKNLRVHELPTGPPKVDNCPRTIKSKYMTNSYCIGSV